MLGQEPHLKLVRSQHVRDEDIVAAIIACIIDRVGCLARGDDDHLVRFGQTTNLHRGRLASSRRPWDLRDLRDVCGHRKRDAAGQLHAFGQEVHQKDLPFIVLVVHQMELVEGRSDHLPMKWPALNGDAKSACVNQAKADRDRAKADIKVTKR